MEARTVRLVFSQLTKVKTGYVCVIPVLSNALVFETY